METDNSPNKNSLPLLTGNKGLSVFFKPFKKLRQAWEKEQKDLIFNRKTRQEEIEYFNFMKFFFNSSDTT
ncbi:MAG TPA: hypothetical protein VES68_02080 [Candidatus Sulfotelmatobacter sp.]|nr:hypothetical protein [Candidatus Sulfotelmatobacter sp.]